MGMLLFVGTTLALTIRRARAASRELRLAREALSSAPRSAPGEEA